jgi:hypothetical protein
MVNRGKAMNGQDFAWLRAFAFILAMAAPGVAWAQATTQTTTSAYDPPVGSRWIVETETRGEETRPDGSTTSLARTRAELTVEAKTADGFRISWIQRGSTVEGTTRSVALHRAFTNVPENVVVRASTNPAGKPLRIDNLVEARAAMRRAADGLAEQFSERPAARALFDQLMVELTDVSAENAASVYIDALGVLAVAQNAGMKPGEYRWTSKAAQNPLGGDALKSNERFERVEADGATGRSTFVCVTSIDPVAMNDFMQSFARSLLAASGDSVTAERVDLLVKSMVFSFDKRAEFEVEDGMTRKVKETSTTVFRGMEQNLIQTESRTIVVTRAPQ